jgi:hypothetical protein
MGKRRGTQHLRGKGRTLRVIPPPSDALDCGCSVDHVWSALAEAAEKLEFDDFLPCDCETDEFGTIDCTCNLTELVRGHDREAGR